MPTTRYRPAGRSTRLLAAAAFVTFLTALGCDSTTPAPQGAGTGGVGGASAAAGGGGPVIDTGAGGLRAGLQANGSIAYVRNK